MVSEKIRISLWAVAAVISIAILVAVIWSIMYIISPGIEYAHDVPAILLTLILVAGVGSLIAILAVVSVILNALGLSDRKEALGLPRGSIRALIALSLILIFSIVSVYLYGELGGTPSQDQTRFAQQILTTVSTLVVAVASFYFGAKSVEEATKAMKSQSSLKISPSGELGMDLTKEEEKSKQITVDTTPADEKITWKVSNDKPESLVQTKPNEFNYKASDNLKDGTTVVLTFALAKHPEESEKLLINIKNKK